MTDSLRARSRRLRTPTAVLLCVSLIACCLLASGCSQGKSYSVVPVSGRITLDGEPLAGARITFQPTGVDPGPGSFGTTDAEGRFSLETMEDTKREGAVPGTHHVQISTVVVGESAGEEDAAPQAGKVLPTKYTDGSLSYDVPQGGTTTADFDIKSP